MSTASGALVLAEGWTGALVTALGAWLLTGPVVLVVIGALVALDWARLRRRTEAERRAHRLREAAELDADPGEPVTLRQAWRDWWRQRPGGWTQ